MTNAENASNPPSPDAPSPGQPAPDAPSPDEGAEPTGGAMVPEPDAASLKFAQPIDFDAGYGEGANRTLVLGGGGIFFVAWQVAYLNGLKHAGVDLEHAELVVGTSAGSLVASIVTAGHLDRFSKKVNMLAKLPALMSALAPSQTFAPSQLRALEEFQAAQDNSPDTLRQIGHAALAASTPSAAETRRTLGLTIGLRGWPSQALRITAADCFTGERLVATHDLELSAVRAASASSAVPGIFAPQPLLDRFCMDGGVSGSGTHCDLVAGAQRTLVISLGAVLKTDIAMMTVPPDNLDVELAGLAKAGTQAELRGPSDLDITRLMDPAAIPDALALGAAQAAVDGPALAKFWNA